MTHPTHHMIDFDLIAASDGQAGTGRLPSRAKRDSEATKSAILTAAMFEFSEHGVSGARIDRIAARANANKSLIYSYFGDKDALWEIVLRAAYAEKRSGETGLDLSQMTPADGVRRLVDFTIWHYIRSPWFLRILAEENLRRGATVSGMDSIRTLQNPLLTTIRKLLDRGRAEGVFHREISPEDLYIFIASQAYFPIANRYTLKAVFGVDTEDAAWRAALVARSQEVVLAYLSTQAPKD